MLQQSNLKGKIVKNLMNIPEVIFFHSMWFKVSGSTLVYHWK